MSGKRLNGGNRSRLVSTYRVEVELMAPALLGEERVELAISRLEDTLEAVIASGELVGFEIKRPKRGKATYRVSEKAAIQLDLPLDTGEPAPAEAA